MDNFNWNFPTEIVYGPGRLKEVGGIAKEFGKKVFLATYERNTVLAPLIDRTISYLQEEGLEVVIFEKIEPNPRSHTIDEGIALFKESGCECIVTADLQSGWISCWEVMKDGYGLGTAATMPPGQIKSIEILKGDPKANGITGHILLIADTDDHGKISYAGGYGWERAGSILTQDTWSDYLTKFCEAEYK